MRTMAQEAWRAYLELALGMTEASRKKAKRAVKELVGKKSATAEQLQAMAEDLVRMGLGNREAIVNMIRAELDRALTHVGLASSEEIAALEARIRELEERLRAYEPAAKAPAAKKAAPAAKKTAATGAVAKKAVAKKTVAKKAVAKKTTAKKAEPPAQPS
jgi:polyhydroxyalkanoate synthesis regulator phasin